MPLSQWLSQHFGHSNGGGDDGRGGEIEDDGPAVAILKTDMEELGSQGMLESADGSAAMLHCSSTPEAYYRAKYGVGGGINMDRGGIG
eukprot:SAG22_NODE_10807_length_515_cov_0.745192_1_plen_87_part_10